jgi:hypothetical protein
MASKGATLLRRWLSVALKIVAVVFLLGLLVWGFDPPVRSKLIEGSIIRWQYIDNPRSGRTLQPMSLVVKLDDGRTVGVYSQRTHWPTEALPAAGERVLVQERMGLLGSRKFRDARMN